MTHARVLIIGGGIGGLTCAAALCRNDFDVEVFEAATQLRVAGSGLTLWPRAMATLKHLGLHQAVVDNAQLHSSIAVVDGRGKRLATVDFAESAQQWGSSSVNVERGELLSTLANVAGKARVCTGKRCVGVNQDAHTVTATFSDGSVAYGDLLIGADGAGSTVRASLSPSGKRSRRYRAWMGIAARPPRSVPEDTSMGVLAKPLAMLMPLTNGRVHWFVEPSGHKARATQHHSPASLAASLGEVPADVVDTITATPAEEFRYLEVRDHLHNGDWGSGRITLLGDAVHAMLPVLGRGACEAIDDAAALTDALSTSDDLIAGLRRYEKRRASVTAGYVRLARRAALLRTGMAPAAALMKLLPPAMIEKQLAYHQRLATG